MPFSRWLKSVNHAIEGIIHAARTQRHLRYHFYSAALAIVISYALGVSRTEFLIIALAVIAVLVAEMLNSAIEAVVDMVSPEHSEQARAAKDIAAGAVLITALGAASVGYIVLLPHLRDIFSEGLRMGEHTSDEVAVVALVLVLISVILLKAYLNKGKPLSGGLPSGHAALAFSVWVSVSFATGSLVVSAFCLVLALMVAAGRITKGVHRVHEVVLGALLGAVLTFVLFVVFM